MLFRKLPSPLQELLPATAGKRAAQLAPIFPKLIPSRRLSKIAMAAAVLGAGMAAALSGHGMIASNNAVISTNLISLRTPIEGTVSGLPSRIGVMVARGARIAHIENLRVNDEHLVDLRERQTRIEADLKGAEANRAALINLRDELIRRLPLEASGIVAQAEMHRLRSQLEAARQEAAAQAARLAALRTEAEAATQGVLTGTTGGTDRSYSAQRADQIELELSALNKTIAALGAEAAETRSRLRPSSGGWICCAPPRS